MERVEIGGVATGMGQQHELNLAATDFVPRFFRSERAGSGRGGGRSHDWSGHGKKKKTGALTWRGDSKGRRRLRQYGIGDGHCCERETRENATGQDMERNQATEMNLPATVPVAMERRQVGVAPL